MAKEKSTTEFKDERSSLLKRSEEIIQAAKGEKREKLSEEEDNELRKNQFRIAEIGVELSKLEMTNRSAGNQHQNAPSFSLQKALRQAVNGEVASDEVASLNQRGKEHLAASGIQTRGQIYIPVEARAALSATGASGTGSDLVDTNFLDILTPLRDRLVLAQAGANVLTGLVGNIDLPAYSGSTANWEGENSAASDGAGTFSHKTMKPKRLTSVLTISKQLLVQDSLGVEAMLRNDIINAVISKLEATVFGNHTHSDSKPDGLFTGFSTAAVALAWDEIVNLETAVDLGNALENNMAYIAHTSLRGAMKKTVKKTAGTLGFILEPDGRLNDFNCLRTNAMTMNAAVTGATPKPAEYGIVFGNWADLILGQWGALDLTVDTTTLAHLAQVRIIINSYWDANVRRDVSFSKALMTI